MPIVISPVESFGARGRSNLSRFSLGGTTRGDMETRFSLGGTAMGDRGDRFSSAREARFSLREANFFLSGTEMGDGGDRFTRRGGRACFFLGGPSRREEEEGDCLF